jgi:DNA-binding MarR family transcriptional regulator
MPPPLVEALHEWMHVLMRRSMHNFMLFAKEKNLSMAQINALFRLNHKGACGVSDLGDDLGVTSAAASQLLERLVQQGLVARSEDPLDRRNKRIVLTEAGQRIVQESIQARQKWLTSLADLLTPAEQEQVEASLRLLIERAALLEEDALVKNLQP